MKALILFGIIFIIFVVYNKYKQQIFFLTITGLSKETGERVWFRTLFYTHLNRLPLKSIECYYNLQNNLDGCIVTDFKLITNEISKSLDIETILSVYEPPINICDTIKSFQEIDKKINIITKNLQKILNEKTN